MQLGVYGVDLAGELFGFFPSRKHRRGEFHTAFFLLVQFGFDGFPLLGAVGNVFFDFVLLLFEFADLDFDVLVPCSEHVVKLGLCSVDFGLDRAPFLAQGVDFFADGFPLNLQLLNVPHVGFPLQVGVFDLEFLDFFADGVSFRSVKNHLAPVNFDFFFDAAAEFLDAAQAHLVAFEAAFDADYFAVKGADDFGEAGDFDF